MAIYLVTAPPGSGKSLYTVSTLIPKLMKPIKLPDGTEVQRRLVVDGIPDLLLDHERLNPPIPDHELPKGYTSRGEGNGVWNWYEWCQPGDLIVIDEVQRHWSPRTLGSKPPREISELATHRHKGVDFIIVTQSSTLLDQFIRRLVSPHIHVRRMWGGTRAMLYEWDMCQVDLRGNTATKTFWNYPKDAYKLYKSSQLHTKQNHKIPMFVFVPVLAILSMVFFGPAAYSKLKDGVQGKAMSTEKTTSSKPAQPAQSVGQRSQPQLSGPPVTPMQPTLPAQQLANVSGCIASATSCRCFDAQSRVIDTGNDLCRIATHQLGYLASPPATNADTFAKIAQSTTPTGKQ